MKKLDISGIAFYSMCRDKSNTTVSLGAPSVHDFFSNNHVWVFQCIFLACDMQGVMAQQAMYDEKRASGAAIQETPLVTALAEMFHKVSCTV